jgi:FlaA1/EpsC-like NDP-sugar epimerase
MSYVTGIYLLFREMIISRRRALITAAFLLQAALANYFAFLIRLDGVLAREDLNLFISYLPLLLLIRLFFYVRSGLYKSLWRYASVSDMVKIIKSGALGSIGFLVLVRLVFGNLAYPRSVFVLDLILFMILTGGSRMFIRILREYMHAETSTKRVLIAGAGDAGELMARQMKGNPEYKYEPVGFIDDDPYKEGGTIHGIPILGPVSALPEAIRRFKPDEILIALPSATSGAIRTIYETSKPFNLSIKKIPRIADILGGNISVSARLGQLLMESGLVTESQVNEALALQKKEGGRLGTKLIKLGHITEAALISFLNKQFSVSHIKPISLEDLLQREPVRTDIQSLREYMGGKSVLVTGAGGSIGSELARQIAKYNPSNLILLDRYENSLFYLDRELREAQAGGKSVLNTVIGDIQDPVHMDYLFARHRPRIIFHAAAYKHVPLMEDHPIEAAKNNIFGTKNLLDLAHKYLAESFVTISTDKAVNPTSVMGATKRISEYLTIGMNQASMTRFTAVRFGNVLGTNGSVVPIFREQLKKGGPLTVTHPQVRRFFMLIPEAMQLVLIAAAIGDGGEIFVLDMGEQIRILDLAENLIRLSGFIPHKEIKISFTGLRPGEKLYEELFDSNEKVLPTSHHKLKIAVSEVPSVRESELDELLRSVQDLSAAEVMEWIRKRVPNFKGDAGSLVGAAGMDPDLRKKTA